MAGPKDIRTGPSPVVTTPGLNEKEQVGVKQDKAAQLKNKEASRLAQQAGFQRVKDKKGKLAFGDSSQAPIPLPDDELDPAAWSQEGLESAEQALSSADVHFEQALKDVADGAEGRMLGISLLESGFMPVEEDLARLQAISERESELSEEAHEQLQVVGQSIGALFGIELGEGTSVAQQVMAAGLIVAGEPGQVSAAEDGLDEKKLASGVQKVTTKGGQAVEQAKTMNQGIGKELNVHRTMVFKR